VLDALKEIKNDDPDVSFLPQVIFTIVFPCNLSELYRRLPPPL
jgi:hypothetical protein